MRDGNQGRGEVPSVDLVEKAFGRVFNDLVVVDRLYTAYLKGTRQELPPRLVPPALYPIVMLIRHCAARGTNLFGNGAGKHLLTQLLNLSAYIGVTWVTQDRFGVG